VAGKQRASGNSTTHGLCSVQVKILHDERWCDYINLSDSWMFKYGPDDDAERTLVQLVIDAEWLLRRAQRRYEEAEMAYVNKPVTEWSEDDHKMLDRFQRYRTSWERSFSRSFAALERYRKDSGKELRMRIREATDAELNHIAEETAKEKEARAEERLRLVKTSDAAERARLVETFEQSAEDRQQVRVEDRQRRTEEFPELIYTPVRLAQWVTVQIREDGTARYEAHPSAREIAEAAARLGHGRPQLVQVDRYLEFVDGVVPAEMSWVGEAPVDGAGVYRQRVGFVEWSRQIVEEVELLGGAPGLLGGVDGGWWGLG
jgi:hypothetical protein